MFAIVGAAYGLAGMVKGLGIGSFKQYSVIDRLVEAIQDKKDFKLVLFSILYKFISTRIRQWVFFLLKGSKFKSTAFIKSLVFNIHI